MMGAAVLGLTIVIASIAAGMLASKALAAAAFPMRVRMFERATQLLAEGRLTHGDRDFLNFCMDHALSPRAAWLPVRAAWTVFRIDIGWTEKSPVSNVPKPPEIAEVSLLFMLSVLVANPGAGLVFIALLIGMMVAERQRARPALQHTAASLQLATC